MGERTLEAKDIIRHPDPRLQVQAQLREVIRDFRGEPARFIRVRLTGWHFPEGAALPFMVIGNAVSRFVRISPDGSIADGYFAGRIPAGRSIEFGYDKTVSWDFPLSVEPEQIERLDRASLPDTLQHLLD